MLGISERDIRGSHPAKVQDEPNQIQRKPRKMTRLLVGSGTSSTLRYSYSGNKPEEIVETGQLVFDLDQMGAHSPTLSRAEGERFIRKCVMVVNLTHPEIFPQ